LQGPAAPQRLRGRAFHHNASAPSRSVSCCPECPACVLSTVVGPRLAVEVGDLNADLANRPIHGLNDSMASWDHLDNTKFRFLTRPTGRATPPADISSPIVGHDYESDTGSSNQGFNQIMGSPSMPCRPVSPSRHRMPWASFSSPRHHPSSPVRKNAWVRLQEPCGLAADPSRAIALCRLDQLGR
jgi:hypothetical protein